MRRRYFPRERGKLPPYEAHLSPQDFLYEKITIASLRQALAPPFHHSPVPGDFLASLRQRLAALAKEDWHRMKFFFWSLRQGRWNLFSLCLNILLLPPLYYALRLCVYLLAGRLWLYLFSFLESFFENFVFVPLGEENYGWLSFLYRYLLLELKYLFQIYCGGSFLLNLYGLDWHRGCFWYALYHYYLRRPFYSRLYAIAWRLVIAHEALSYEIWLDGWWAVLLRKGFFPSLLRALQKLNFLLSRRGRSWFRLRFLHWNLRRRRFQRLLRIHAIFWKVRGGITLRGFFWALRRALKWPFLMSATMFLVAFVLGVLCLFLGGFFVGVLLAALFYDLWPRSFILPKSWNLSLLIFVLALPCFFFGNFLEELLFLAFLAMLVWRKAVPLFRGVVA